MNAPREDGDWPNERRDRKIGDGIVDVVGTWLFILIAGPVVVGQAATPDIDDNSTINTELICISIESIIFQICSDTQTNR